MSKTGDPQPYFATTRFEGRQHTNTVIKWLECEECGTPLYATGSVSIVVTPRRFPR